MRKLNVTDRQTDGQTDRQTDGRGALQYLVAISPVPGPTAPAGDKKGNALYCILKCLYIRICNDLQIRAVSWHSAYSNTSL